MNTRRATLTVLLFGAAMPFAVVAQNTADFGRPGVRRGARPGVDEALRRTVRLVLRAEARSQPLPGNMTYPEPFPEEMIDLVTAGAPVPEGLKLTPVPDRVDRRLPHSRRGTVWAVAGTWMLEIDAVRSRIILVAHDVLPPDI